MKTRSKKLTENIAAKMPKENKREIVTRNKKQNQINGIKTRSPDRLTRNQTSNLNQASKNEKFQSKSSNLHIERNKRSDPVKTRSKTSIQIKLTMLPQNEPDHIVGSHIQELMEYNGDYRVFVVGDLVWAKLKGWPAWPAKVGNSFGYFFPK